MKGKMKKKKKNGKKREKEREEKKFSLVAILYLSRISYIRIASLSPCIEEAKEKYLCRFESNNLFVRPRYSSIRLRVRQEIKRISNRRVAYKNKREKYIRSPKCFSSIRIHVKIHRAGRRYIWKRTDSRRLRYKRQRKEEREKEKKEKGYFCTRESEIKRPNSRDAGSVHSEVARVQRPSHFLSAFHYSANVAQLAVFVDWPQQTRFTVCGAGSGVVQKTRRLAGVDGVLYRAAPARGQPELQPSTSDSSSRPRALHPYVSSHVIHPSPPHPPPVRYADPRLCDLPHNHQRHGPTPAT